jgi:chromosome segregation ATPase
MKNRLGIVVLALVCLGLFIAIVTVKRQATAERTAVLERAETASNQTWVQLNGKVEELKNVNSQLEKDTQVQKSNYDKTVAELTNNYSTATATLAKTETELKTAQDELKQRDTKIADLEKENHTLDARASELSASLTNLNLQIADTKQKLATSEGNRTVLEGELKRLMGEKTELERQFNDLNVLRSQVAKLKTEQNIARRIEWMRNGLYASADEKGAQRLMSGISAPTPTGKANPNKPNYDLNVEVTSDGSVRIIPPVTNAPAAR